MKLGWQPRISFEQLITEMVIEYFKLAQQDLHYRQTGFDTFNYHE